MKTENILTFTILAIMWIGLIAYLLQRTNIGLIESTFLFIACFFTSSTAYIYWTDLRD